MNAADAIHDAATENGEIRLSCSQKDGWLVMSVIDNGPGIAEGLLSKVFEPYVTTKKNGHGLGLSTSYRIITNHKGRLTGNNNPGGGAIFTIELPLE